MPTYRIHFTVVIDRKLRSKWRDVTAKTPDAAEEKLRKEFGRIKVWKNELKK